MGEGVVTESAEPTPPIVLVDGDDVTVFAARADAEAQVEPPDAGDETGYDALGRRLRFESEGRTVRISLAEREAASTAPLEACLRGFLRRLGEPAGDDGACGLPCLVEAASRHAYVPVGPVEAMRRRLWRRSRDG
ncbi:MAG TPA: hypothetical protein VHJ34_06120 [Actinomycetota bacterium]|nr:hypothetical protein [Actinomycetota bacterium]